MWQPVTGKHKRLVSDDKTAENTCPWLQQPLACSVMSASCTMGSSQTGSSPQPRATSRGQQACNRENNGLLHGSAGNCAQGLNDSSALASSVVMEGVLKYKGVKVRVKSSPTGLSWKPPAGAWGWCLEIGALSVKIPYDEVLGAWSATRTKRCSCLCRTEHVVVVAALHRPRGNPSAWRLQEHVLVAGTHEQAKTWVAAITCALQLCYDRPRALLVFINPYSGSKRARRVWQQEAAPVFFKAGIRVSVVETTAADHARSLLASMKADELAQYQGVVAVGGDGVFQECVMGLMAQRARGGKNTAVAVRMRVGHIPGGSTDAVAYTLHGTRSAEAAALHIALGDRMALDVARVDCHAEPPMQQVMDGHGATAAAYQPPSSCPPSSAAAPGSRATAHVTAFAVEPGATAAAPPTAGSMGAGLAAGDAHTNATGGLGSSRDATFPSVGASTGSDGTGLMQSLQDPRTSCSSSVQQPAAAGQPGTLPGQAPQVQQLLPGVNSLGPAGASESAALIGEGGVPIGGGAGGEPPAPPALSSRYFVCQAAYGFLGDVMQFSEGLRFMGPTRYDVSGLVQFLRLRTYPLHISYKPAPQEAADRLRLCSTQCEACRMAGIHGPRITGDDASMLLAPRDLFGAVHHSHNHHPPPHTAAHMSPSAASASAALPPLPVQQLQRDGSCQHASISPDSTGGAACGAGAGAPLGSAFSRMASSPLSSPPVSMLSTATPPARPTAGGLSLAGSGRAASAQLAALPSASKLAVTAAANNMRSSASSGKLILSSGQGPHSGGSQGPPSGGHAGSDGSITSSARPSVTSFSGTTTTTATTVEHTLTGMPSAAIPETSDGGGFGACTTGSGTGTDGEWVTLEGEFVSVMAVVTPCRSDKTIAGIIPHAHLSDGRIYLVLVRKCHHLDYLRFLIRLTNKGLDDNCLPFVKVVPVTAAVVRPLQGGPASVWNVDGELLPQPGVTLRVARGMQDVFARGVEMGAFIV